MALIIRADRAIADPLPDTPALRLPALVSDAFTGPDVPDLRDTARPTDSAYGGVVKHWQASPYTREQVPEFWGVTDGELTFYGDPALAGTTARTIAVAVDAPSRDYEATITVPALPTGDIFFSIRRTSISTLYATPCVMLTVKRNGLTQIAQRGGTMGPVVGLSEATIQPGDNITLGAVASEFYWAINDQLMGKSTLGAGHPSASVPGLVNFGIIDRQSTPGDQIVARIDDLRIDTPRDASGFTG